MVKERINSLRNLFEEYSIDGYIVPSNDKYMSEYVPEYAKRLEYITGFTGSNGMAVICKDIVLFFTDGRYLEQARKELDPQLFKIFDLKDIFKFAWKDYLSRVWYDPELFTYPAITNLLDSVDKPWDDNLQKIKGNLIDKIWQNQPQEPNSQVYLHDIQFAGVSHIEKINKCREIFLDSRLRGNNIKKNKNDKDEYSLVILDSSSICWLLNMRASDVAYTPLMFAKVIITPEKLYLFINPARISLEIIEERPEITILPEEGFENILKDQDNIFIDDSISSIHIMDLIADKKVHKIKDPCLMLKACKNEVEIKHAIDFHIKDAVALCEFFTHLDMDSRLRGNDINEYTLGLKLTEYRAKQEGYVSDSFLAICGFRENSAIIHYRADVKTAKKIEGQGILLIDSGGQYKGATTDITRTITIGIATDEQKKRYTQVLKGHIALTKAKFPKNIITGANLDILARQYLWQDELDYPHGTGHGVGSFLSVHEGPQSINLRNKTILQAGMILSNEPGFYIPGEYGIRIENLIYIKENKGWLEFETLSLVPYAKELIDVKLLNNDEINYIKHYYQKIKTQIHHLLSPAAQKWLNNEINLFL
ncbi:aminopeptidase [Rickettsia sp. MEAM1 (Bemisia tabaci)]|uniref:aminopeptidase P family protein n=1 Tax=unclassified Rickettsia TaxID=114295 RepID=UPI00082C12BC|nr:MULTISPECIES: aminopeptidase P family protein [unclassified Rickettsia]ASX28579.1 aminopeptidase [Rickettsia sp. MEAM1 (Bemisia tabaci)]ODA37049.1 aminopeptidase [Rickettsia sp. wb]ODA37074.1 aminopeptidase [Rickettsia sp. wq]